MLSPPGVVYIYKARRFYICISTFADESYRPPCFGNCFIATFCPLSKSTANQTKAIPPFPSILDFSYPSGVLLPYYYLSSSLRRTCFLLFKLSLFSSNTIDLLIFPSYLCSNPIVEFFFYLVTSFMGFGNCYLLSFLNKMLSFSVFNLFIYAFCANCYF